MLLLDANREKFKELHSEYTENIEDVLALQGTLIRDILPGVVEEVGVDNAQQWEVWARDWLEDQYSMFRILRRNKFTRSFTIEAVRKILIWRSVHLWPPACPVQIPLIQCLPSSVTDPFGRPILVLKVVSFNDSSDDHKPRLLRALECLRLHLRSLNDSSPQSPHPILQYVVLLDLKNLSTQSLNIDLVTWALREATPRFPGLLAAVFMINYSWTHAGIWSIAKRVLPERALSRVFFPTSDELLRYFSPSMLPQDYGGSLASLTELPNPLRQDPPAHGSRHQPPPQSPTPSPLPGPSIPKNAPPVTTSIHPTSLLNPFFGYPVSSSGTSRTPSLSYGRQRKRDLIRTLLLLAWTRWGRHAIGSVCVAALALIFARRRRAVFFLWERVRELLRTS